MSFLLTGVGMCWRGDGQQGIQWSVVKKSLHQDLSLPQLFPLPNLSPKSRGSVFVLSLDVGKGQQKLII
jgi:hypothetical protein